MTEIHRINDSVVTAALALDGARLEYRWVVATPTVQDSSRKRVFDPMSRKWLMLGDTVVLDLARARNVTVSHSPDPEHSAVMLQLNMVNADRMMGIMGRHLHEQLAITLNGRLLFAPFVGNAGGSSIPVAVDLDSVVAVQLGSRLRAALRGNPGRN